VPLAFFRARFKFSSFAGDNEFLMGKNGTDWDFFEGFPSHLAIFGDETPRESAAQWVLVGSS